jgi:hypothetical protein
VLKQSWLLLLLCLWRPLIQETWMQILCNMTIQGLVAVLTLLKPAAKGFSAW